MQATITIGAERRIIIDKALQAGEKIGIAIAGLPQGTAASGVRLALCAPTRATVAACVEFAASGQAVAGEMSLATSELAALLAGVATGRLMHVAAVIFDAATEAVYGSGYVPVVALPIGPQFDPIPEPLEYVTQAMLDAAIEGLAEVARTGDYADLHNKPTIPAPVPVVPPSTNAADAGKAADAYATGNALAGYLPLTGGTMTGDLVTGAGVDAAQISAAQIRTPLITGTDGDGQGHDIEFGNASGVFGVIGLEGNAYSKDEADAAFATAAQGAKADSAVQPGQRNLLDYATGATLAPQTAVYRVAATLSGTDATIPTPDATAIPTAAAYFCFEMEVSVDATATSLAGPSGWTWLDGGELPTSGFAGATLYIACRLDCTTRAVVANVWRVEEAQ